MTPPPPLTGPRGAGAPHRAAHAQGHGRWWRCWWGWASGWAAMRRAMAGSARRPSCWGGLLLPAAGAPRPPLAHAAPVKRFYEAVVEAAPDGGILLDGRPVRTPARAPASIAQCAAGRRGRRQRGEVADAGGGDRACSHAPSPASPMPRSTGSRRIPPPAARTSPAMPRATSPATRADGPASLVARQAEGWDPLLDWARARYDVSFVVTAGIVHVAQPPATIARLGEAVSARTPFALAGLFRPRLHHRRIAGDRARRGGGRGHRRKKASPPPCWTSNGMSRAMGRGCPCAAEARGEQAARFYSTRAFFLALVQG